MENQNENIDAVQHSVNQNQNSDVENKKEGFEENAQNQSQELEKATPIDHPYHEQPESVVEFEEQEDIEKRKERALQLKSEGNARFVAKQFEEVVLKRQLSCSKKQWKLCRNATRTICQFFIPTSQSR